MSVSKIFHGVTEAVFDCVKTTSAAQHGTVYSPPTGDTGTATTNTVVGTVVLSFNLDSTTASITYTIVQKPWIVSSDQIFGGIGDSINGCLKA